MKDMKYIVIADDEAECRNEFTSCSDEFKVCKVKNVNDLMMKLEDLFSKGCRPDLVLLDVWCPPNQTPPDQKDREKRAIAGLQELSEQMEKTKAVVEEAWIPRGFHILKELRQKWPNPDDLPIAMYSKRGHFLATSDELELVENLKTHWILKHDKNEYFEYVQDRIDRLIDMHRNNRQIKQKIKRIKIIYTTAIFISIFLLFLFLGEYKLASHSLLSVLVSCVLSVPLTYGFKRLVARWVEG